MDMIQPQELRLNNLVLYKDEVSIVKGVLQMSVDLLVNPCISFTKLALLPNIYPIPLTEEWLIKLGFHEVLGVYAGYGREINLKLVDGYWDAYFKGKYVSVIKHVHQLQNMYFALTRHELTLK